MVIFPLLSSQWERGETLAHGSPTICMKFVKPLPKHWKRIHIIHHINLLKFPQGEDGLATVLEAKR